MAKNMPKIADVSIFAIFRLLTSNKTSPNYFFLVEEFLSSDLVGHMWQSVKNWLQEWVFRKISHKIFPQEFSARIYHKIFPQDFPKLDPDWLAPHHPIPNAKYPPITAFLKLAFSPPPFPARFSCKIFQQQFPTRFSRNNFPQDFPTTISHKIFLQDFPELDPHGLAPHHPIPNAKFSPITAFLKLAFSPAPFPARFSCKNFLQDFPTRISCKIFPQQFPVRFSWARSSLVGSPPPYSKC